MAKTLLWAAVWGLGWWLLVAGEARAQTNVPGAPTITAVTAGSSSSVISLDVTWTAPSDDGGSTVTAYDVALHQDR